MNQLYILSYHVQTQRPRICRRPWWNLFGRDTLVWEPEWRVIKLEGLTENQAALVRNATQVEELGELFTSLICRPEESVSHVQLEVQQPEQLHAEVPAPAPEAAPSEPVFELWSPKVGGVG